MKKIILISTVLTISIAAMVIFYFSRHRAPTTPAGTTTTTTLTKVSLSTDYPSRDLFPYQNINTGIYAKYTNPMEITIYKPNNLTNAQARLDIDTDFKNVGASLSQLESLGVKILIKPVSDLPTQE